MDARDLYYIIEAHTFWYVNPNKAFRKWDGKTPYYVHPLWCATMIATETALDERTREEGILALLYHDVLEDTRQPLPGWLSDRVKGLIEGMTFKNGSSQEMQEIWSRPREVRLYKLYDKASNLLDGVWMDEQKRKKYQDYTRNLLEDAEQNYGALNITRIVRGILQ